MKKLTAILLAFIMVVSAIPVAFAAETETVILFTNDIHCNIDGYPVLAAYRAELIAQGKNVITVDAGDAIQGEVIGSMTEGEAVVDIMNSVGYDYAAPGNHEFDYGVDRLLELAQDKAQYKYISSNFYNLTSLTPVFDPYLIKDLGDYQIAFVGISTPDTITSSSPDYFKDENGNFIYGFPVYPDEMTNEALYTSVQESVDDAIADGADIVIAVGHAGILGSTEGWMSSDIIANTDGIDYFIDAHSHETIEGDVYKNKNNEDVILASTGEKFNNFGVLEIGGKINLVSTNSVDVKSMSDSAQAAYNTVQEKIDGYYEEIEFIYEELGTSEAKLVIYDSNGNRIVRSKETNAGDFVADAYRAVTGADIAIANGGGIRAEIEAGTVTRQDLMNVNAFNNDMCVIEITGQQLIDILEHGARECPNLIGGFFQVSGVSFEIHTYIPTPVIVDQLDNFIGLDATKERRVQNVLVGGEPVDLAKTYTLAGSQYVLLSGGDGLTMLSGVKVIQSEGLPCDSEMLIQYFTEVLGGVISSEQYGNPDGDGRITILNEKPEEPVIPECEHICHSENGFLAFLWDIAVFFCRLFGIQPVCSCGENHYDAPFFE
ncbi:MAG: bifunctional metallophosphatase/5'-nucleotidase [Clostridia bacterium]|nr:bifunctional metallophosphatase/5'-nucleotidase [Clostridia bacterium]